MAAGDKMPGKPRLGSKHDEGKRKFNKHERDLADKLGGFRQPNSGALAHRKGDVLVDGASVLSSERLLLDSKQCMGSTIILSTRDLVKISREALEIGKEPGLILTFETGPGIVNREWVLLPLDVVARLLVNQK